MFAMPFQNGGPRPNEVIPEDLRGDSMNRLHTHMPANYRLGRWTMALALVLVGQLLTGCAGRVDVIRHSATEAKSVSDREPVRTFYPGPSLFVPKQQDEIRYHFLPIGPGMCRVIECPGAGAPDPLVVDCGALAGGHGEGDYTRDDAIAYVRAVVGSRPTVIAISHPDQDHSSYLPYIFPDSAAVRRVVYGGVFGNYPVAVRAWMNQLVQAGVPVDGGFAPDFHNGGNAVPGLACGIAGTHILTVNSGNTANDNSMMLRIGLGNFTVILPGDATGVSQNAAMGNYPAFGELHSTIVSGSHHGADTHGSNSPAWAAATVPLATIFEAGLRFYHPRCTAVDVYRQAGGLAGAIGHRLQCGTYGGWSPNVPTVLAEYNTEDVGLIVVTSDANPANMSIYCNGYNCYQ